MAKQAKLPQTDWTRGGRDISNTAIPYYQSNLTRMDQYLQDPYARQDEYLNRYYGANAIQNQDFLRNYNRQMANQIGANYAATGGGYTSSGERAFYDRQKLQNNLAARLNQYGIQSAYNMSDQDYQNMLAANQAYNEAYELGKPYSQIEQQNALAKQANRNWIAPVATIAGTALGSIAGAPQIGAALGGAVGNAFTTDTSGALAAIYGGGNQASDWTNGGTFTNIAAGLKDVDWAGQTRNIKNWWNNLGGATAKGTGAATSSGLPLWTQNLEKE